MSQRKIFNFNMGTDTKFFSKDTKSGISTFKEMPPDPFKLPKAFPATEGDGDGKTKNYQGSFTSVFDNPAARLGATMLRGAPIPKETLFPSILNIKNVASNDGADAEIKSIEEEARASQLANEEQERQRLLSQEDQSSSAPVPPAPRSFFSRHKGKMIGGVIGGIIGTIPLALLITGVILLPFTFGSSAPLIGLGIVLMGFGVAAGASIGFDIGAGFDRRQRNSRKTLVHGSYKNFGETFELKTTESNSHRITTPVNSVIYSSPLHSVQPRQEPPPSEKREKRLGF